MNRRHFARALGGAAVGATLRPPAYPLVSGDSRALPFRLSVMLWTVYPELPFEKRLEKVAEAGYSAVELVNEFEKWSEEDFRRVNVTKRRMGITFDATAGVRTGAADPGSGLAFLEEVKRLLQIAARLECPSIIVLSGDRIESVERAVQHGTCVDNLKRAGNLASKQGVTVLLEPIDLEEAPKIYLSSLTEAAEIVGQADNPNVKLLYDFYHEQVDHGNLIAKLEKYIGLIGLVHVADVPGRHEPGTGEINYSTIFRKLAELKYNRYVAMEFFSTANAVESLRSARELAIRAINTS
jgi:hydroxypyruvate isomerase